MQFHMQSRTGEKQFIEIAIQIKKIRFSRRFVMRMLRDANIRVCPMKRFRTLSCHYAQTRVRL